MSATSEASVPAITPAPPRAGWHLPRLGAAIPLLRDPTEFFRRARSRHGDTFQLEFFGRRLFCVFSPTGIRSLWAIPESTASKGLADFEMLRHKVPDDLFAGRRTLPHDLFSKDDVTEYLRNVENSIDRELEGLGDEGEFEIFDFMRRFGHRVGLASWGGIDDASEKHLPTLIRALDALDSSESFVHPDRAIRTVLSGKKAEKEALATLERAYADIIRLRSESRATEAADKPDLFDRIQTVWGDVDSPDQEIGIARDVVLVHMGSMSNLFAANSWTFIHLLDRPSLVEAIRGGDRATLVRSAHESIRLRQRSIVLRRALKDFEFDDGEQTYQIRSGVFLATTMAVTNTEALPRLETFDAEHYEGARFVRRGELEVPELVTTFGHGLHSCPAMRFSITTIELLIAALFDRYDFEPLYPCDPNAEGQRGVGQSRRPTGRAPGPLRRQIGGVARADRACPVRYQRRSVRDNGARSVQAWS